MSIKASRDYALNQYEEGFFLPRIFCTLNATIALENGMDIKTLSAIIGHVSSETTLNIYSHVTDTMRVQAAVKMIEEKKKEIAAEKKKVKTT